MLILVAAWFMWSFYDSFRAQKAMEDVIIEFIYQNSGATFDLAVGAYDLKMRKGIHARPFLEGGDYWSQEQSPQDDRTKRLFVENYLRRNYFDSFGDALYWYDMYLQSGQPFDILMQRRDNEKGEGGFIFAIKYWMWKKVTFD